MTDCLPTGESCSEEHAICRIPNCSNPVRGEKDRNHCSVHSSYFRVKDPLEIESLLKKLPSMVKKNLSVRTGRTQVEITATQVIDIWNSQNGHCAWCGEFIDYFTRPVKDNMPSLDRIDNDGNYSQSNCQITHLRCNLMQNSFEANIVIATCLAVVRLHYPHLFHDGVFI